MTQLIEKKNKSTIAYPITTFNVFQTTFCSGRMKLKNLVTQQTNIHQHTIMWYSSCSSIGSEITLLMDDIGSFSVRSIRKEFLKTINQNIHTLTKIKREGIDIIDSRHKHNNSIASMGVNYEKKSGLSKFFPSFHPNEVQFTIQDILNMWK